jgi:hypothetical protein
MLSRSLTGYANDDRPSMLESPWLGTQVNDLLLRNSMSLLSAR